MTGTTLLLGAVASASCLLCMEVGGISIKDALVMPSHAKKEVVYRQHRDVIRQMESLIQSSLDFGAVARRVKAAGWPDKVFHVSLRCVRGSASNHRDVTDESPEPGYSKTVWTNLRTVIRDGAGYGTVLTDEGQRKLLVVDNSHRTLGGDTVAYTIYLEQPGQ